MTYTASPAAAATDWLDRFKTAGAIWEYHPGGPHVAFEMAPKHAGFYFHTGIVTANAGLVDEITAVFAQICAAKKIKPDRVISYTAGIANGKIFASHLAKALSVKTGLVDLEKNTCGFEAKGEKLLIVADEIVSGDSLDHTIKLISTAGGVVLSSLFTLGNLYGQPSFKGRAINSLFEHEPRVWDAAACPLCRKGSPALKARQQWRELTEK